MQIKHYLPGHWEFTCNDDQQYHNLKDSYLYSQFRKLVIL